MVKDDRLRLEEIQAEMGRLVEEAGGILRRAGGQPYERARAYWLAHIEMALTKEHGYLGGSMVTFSDTLRELREDEDGDDEVERLKGELRDFRARTPRVRT